MRRIAWLFCVVALIATPSALRAEEVQVETVAEGLQNPTGIAVQPETGDIFVAESGALRVVRIDAGKAQETITGFTKDVYGTGLKYDIGPLGIAFLDKQTLVVGDGGKADGDEELLVFKLPAKGEQAIAPDTTKVRFQLAASGETKGEGNFYGVATTKNGIYVTTSGDDTKGWVAKADVNGTKVTDFRRFIATKEAVKVDAPVGITISPRGEVVVAQMGEINIPGDGRLSFYSAKDGRLLADYATGLHDTTALAYSPKGQLYALDFAWQETEQGGLYQLVVSRGAGALTIEGRKVASLVKPTAMAFATDGTLYITVIGGKLLRIAPGL